MNKVAIIGGGISGLMAALELVLSGKEYDITIFDKGNKLDKRKCFADENNECKHCHVCAITCGLAGAGARSDGKFNIGTSYGGTLANEITEDKALEYICKTEKLLDRFKNNDSKITIYGTNEDLSTLCIQNDLRLLDMKTKHYGTENIVSIMRELINYLCSNSYPSKVKILHLVEVMNIIKDDNKEYKLKYYDNCLNDESEDTFTYVIIATGRSGSKFVKELCISMNIPIKSNSVDIGVRVEMDNKIWEHFSSKIYEPKILYKTKTFEDYTRMFCFNRNGYVSAENNNGVITANGHSYNDPSKGSKNCNFAILSSITFEGAFNKPTEYAENIAKNMNFAGDGNIIIQRFGDLIRGRRTTERRLAQNSVKPTMKAFPGDLSIVLPYRALTNIIETIYALNKVSPGTANDDTLLYGCENKYYSLKPRHDKKFAIDRNLYLIGDGSGISRGLSQAGAMGLFVADCIIEKTK